MAEDRDVAGAATAAASTCRVGETVTDAAHGLDERAVFAELLAQRAHVHVDVAVGDDRVLADHAAQQVGAREHAAGVRGQEVQQPHLGRRQVEQLLGDARFVAAEVDRQGAAHDPFAAAALRRAAAPRRSTTLTRATSSRGLKGLAM
jgi:hypothetical protein